MAKQVKNVRQVYSLPDLALLAGILAVGLIISLFVPVLAGLGYTLLTCLVLMIPFWKHGYRIAGEEGVFSQKELLVPRECKDQILAFLEGRSESLDLKPTMNGGALVNVYTRRKDDRVLAGYFDYADFAVGKEYDLHELSPEQLARLEETVSQRG